MKRRKKQERIEKKRFEHEIMLNQQMDKTDPYPERINIKKDSLRSDLFCIRNYGSAYMTVVSMADDSTVSYIREDSVSTEKVNQLSEIIEKQKESLLIWKDRVESLHAARLAVKITTLTMLKRLALKFLICYFLFGVICSLIPATYSFMTTHIYLLVLSIFSIGLITAYITSYVYSPILKLERELDEKKDSRI